MSTNDIFNRRNMLIESVDIDSYLIVAEGLGSNIVDLFKRLKDAVINFFKKIIDKIKRPRQNTPENKSTSNNNNNNNKNSQQSGQSGTTNNQNVPPVVKKSRRDEVITKAKNSSIVFNEPMKNPQPLQNGLAFQEHFIQDINDASKKFENLPFEDFKRQTMGASSIGKESHIDKRIEVGFYTKNKVTKMSEVNFETFFDYIEGSDKQVNSLNVQKNTILRDLNEAESKAKSNDEKQTDIVQKAKFVMQLQLRAVNVTMREIDKIKRKGESLIRQVK